MKTLAELESRFEKGHKNREKWDVQYRKMYRFARSRGFSSEEATLLKTSSEEDIRCIAQERMMEEGK